MTRGLIIAAPRSGSGKTTITLALLAAFRRRALSVRAGKSGPDYIDPAFHAAASGSPGCNLDSWAMNPSLLGAIAQNVASNGDLFIIESSMGLFDGIDGPPGRTGAAADLARRFQLPVVLVLDVSGQSQSAAAVARGFASHDPTVRLAGVILNQVASPRHREGVTQAMMHLGLPILGSVSRDSRLALPERHLGLVQADEHSDLNMRLAHLADMGEDQLDLDGIMQAAAPFTSTGDLSQSIPPPGQRIALAQDAAFSFIYPHLLQSWRALGAEIRPFSPLSNEEPPRDCDACWLPGGYPELYAAALASATHFQSGLIEFAHTKPVHGECGGYMVLGETLQDADGHTHKMCGLLSQTTSFKVRRLHLGYREATLLSDGPIGRAGEKLRGHEFHYASVIQAGTDRPFANFTDATLRPLGLAGGRRGNVSGSFFHAIALA